MYAIRSYYDVRRVVMRLVTLNRRDVERRRQVIDDGIEQVLHALVLEGGPAQHRHNRVGHGRAAQAAADLIVGELPALEA